MKTLRSYNPKRLSRLQRDILRTVLYFDIFEHPLSPSEVYRFLPSNSTNTHAIVRACKTPPLSTFLRWSGDFVSASSRDPHLLVKSRIEKEERARRYWPIARFMAHVIRIFPFVRGVCVSGELSKGVLTPHGDVDFVVFTETNRLWLCRTLLILFKKTALFNSKRFFCLNHFTSEPGFESAYKRLYEAIEINTLIPLTDHLMYCRYMQRNQWVESILPQTTIPAKPPKGPGLLTQSLQVLFELPFRGPWGDSIEQRLMSIWKQIWKKRYPSYDDRRRENLFRCEPHLSTSYAGDFYPRIMALYRERLNAYSLGANGTKY